MATWHQERAGLGNLYAPPTKGHKVVIDPPGNMAGAMLFRRKRDALRYMRNCPHCFLISAKRAA